MVTAAARREMVGEAVKKRWTGAKAVAVIERRVWRRRLAARVTWRICIMDLSGFIIVNDKHINKLAPPR